MERIYEGAVGRVHVGEAEVYVDNQARRRSGHMSHGMLELSPGRLLVFNSNCSALRYSGHAAFGWIEYRYSEDYGRTWGGIHELECSKQAFLDGLHTYSVEKAVLVDGVITAAICHNDEVAPISCEPWFEPLYIQSFDLGQTWTEPRRLSPWAGRVYDMVARDGVIYALEMCNPNFVAKGPEDLYRLLTSRDNGRSFHFESIVDIDTLGHGYGALQFREDGSLLAYGCNIADGHRLSVSVSHDCGRHWTPQPDITLTEGIRNVQITPLGKGYLMHGRGFRHTPGGKGLVLYTSLDGLEWDDGLVLEPDKVMCYYSNSMRMSNGEVLMQYSETYSKAHATHNAVNVMHRFISVV